jgi:hypothetical protein
MRDGGFTAELIMPVKTKSKTKVSKAGGQRSAGVPATANAVVTPAVISAAKAGKTHSRSKPMNEQFTRQAQDMFKAAQDAKIPESLQAMAEDGVAKTREAYQKVQDMTKGNAKVVEEVVMATQAGVKAIGEKVLTNTTANAAAAFDAAQAMARARSIPEAARLQADFMQQTFAIAGNQTKELFELSAKVARQTIETVNAAATRSFDQFKR